MPTTHNTVPLPPQIQQVLDNLLASARSALGDSLRSVVLFGSAAEGQLRATSDVNLMLVLKRFERTEIDRLRDALRMAHAAARVEVMFVLDSELPVAAEAFAVKFADIHRRRRVLFGDDPVATLTISREAQIRRLQQVLVNLTLRLRERYALVSLREEQLAVVVADAAGPLRAAAATVLELEGRPAPSPQVALENIAANLDGDYRQILANVAETQKTRTLPAGTAGPTVFALLELTARLRARTERMGHHVA
ncbi:MAG: nucleotidyltransferase domain-containing protein [Verrucomicrobia bacterium]|nr:nucleotidyltransferase domain-containing protein [Verrucomicrobiota bacterium]